MSKSFLSLGMLVAMLLLSACNTVSGVGQDIKAGGQAVENAAKK